MNDNLYNYCTRKLGDDITATYKHDSCHIIFLHQGSDFKDKSKKIWFREKDVIGFEKALKAVLSDEIEIGKASDFLRIYKEDEKKLYIDWCGPKYDPKYLEPYSRIIMEDQTASALQIFIRERMREVIFVSL